MSLVTSPCCPRPTASLCTQRPSDMGPGAHLGGALPVPDDAVQAPRDVGVQAAGQVPGLADPVVVLAPGAEEPPRLCPGATLPGNTSLGLGQQRDTSLPQGAEGGVAAERLEVGPWVGRRHFLEPRELCSGEGQAPEAARNPWKPWVAPTLGVRGPQHCGLHTAGA